MTILLYDYFDLEERSSKTLNVWKACHLILYVSAAIFGITNYVFLQNTMGMVDGNCVIYPRKLEFHSIELQETPEVDLDHEMHDFNVIIDDTTEANATVPNAGDTGKVKRETSDNETVTEQEDVVTEAPFDGEVFFTRPEKRPVGMKPWISHLSVTLYVKRKPKMNETHRLVLDTSRTLFEISTDCDFVEYMPIMSTIFAGVWITLFTMCPRGGRTRTGLQQPWRILPPALIFALVMVGVTGHSFTLTNGGLHAFCAAFYDVSNSTTCSSVNVFLEPSWNATWSFSGRVAATRAACAGVLASWACGAALLLARCLVAPDFILRRTDVYIAKDPQQKVIPHLLKSQKYHKRSNQSSPSKRDNASMRSEPTVTTELVTASVEQGEDTAPTSLTVTPVTSPRKTDDIEMQERINHN